MKRESLVFKKSIEVFEPSTPSDKACDYTVEGIEAYRLVNNGDADMINRGRGVRLKRHSDATGPRKVSAMRDQSAKPTQALLERAIDGSKSASIAILSWKGCVLGSKEFAASRYRSTLV